MKKNKLAQLQITGYNLNNLLNVCIKENIELQDIVKLSPQQMEVKLSDKNLKKFNKLNIDNYEIKVKYPSLFQRFLHFLIFRIGLIAGMVASIVLILVMQSRLININIYGLDNINREEIIEKVNEFGIKKFSQMNFNCEDLEKYLMKNFDLSFVSIIKKGNTLIINAKEELPDISKDYLPITADYNMIIKDIRVYSGTSCVKNGDIVFEGDNLIEPYEIINGERINIIPCAEIQGEVYFCSSYEFREKEEICARTGEYQVINIEYYLGKYKLFGNKYDCKYSDYDIEIDDKMITNYFLPIHIKKTIAYKKETVELEKDFEKEKEGIIDKLKKEAYSKVPDYLHVEGEDIKINSTNYGNIVTIYLKSSVYLKYESK